MLCNCKNETWIKNNQKNYLICKATVKTNENTTKLCIGSIGNTSEIDIIVKHYIQTKKNTCNRTI